MTDAYPPFRALRIGGHELMLDGTPPHHRPRAEGFSPR